MTQSNPLAIAVDELRERDAHSKLSAAEAAVAVWFTFDDNGLTLDALQTLETRMATGALVIGNALSIDNHEDSLWLYLVGAELLNGSAVES